MSLFLEGLGVRIKSLKVLAFFSSALEIILGEAAEVLAFLSFMSSVIWALTRVLFRFDADSNC